MPNKTTIEVKFQAVITVDLNSYPGMTFETMSDCAHSSPEIKAKIQKAIECVALKHID